MAILKIYETPDDVLRQISKPVDESVNLRRRTAT